MVKVRSKSIPRSVKLQMTSMIDIVFLLLSFFVITYKTPQVEGDFNIRMPAQSQSLQVSSLDDLTPITVKLSSDAAGNLTGIHFGNQSLGTDMNFLRQAVFKYVQEGDPIDFTAAVQQNILPKFRTDFELEIDCDPQLLYKYEMMAITAVTGYINSENQTIKLVEKIKFTPPK